MLDAQANAARDAGTTLVFDPNRKVGQQADFSQFGQSDAGGRHPEQATAASRPAGARRQEGQL